MMFSVIKYLFQMISQDCERNSKSVGYEKCLGELVDYDDKMREELKNNPELLQHYLKTLEKCEEMHYEEVMAMYADGFGGIVGVRSRGIHITRQIKQAKTQAQREAKRLMKMGAARFFVFAPAKYTAAT